MWVWLFFWKNQALIFLFGENAVFVEFNLNDLLSSVTKGRKQQQTDSR